MHALQEAVKNRNGKEWSYLWIYESKHHKYCEGISLCKEYFLDLCVMLRKATFAILICFAVLTTSCKMQLYTVESDLKQVDSAYVFENDTIRITYNFWYRGGKMNFTIYNKLDVPLFIDWKNSSFIIDDVPSPYWIDMTTTSAVGAGYNNLRGHAVYSSASTAIKEDRVSIIPSRSYVTRAYVSSVDNWFHLLDQAKSWRNYINYSTKEGSGPGQFCDNHFQRSQPVKVSRNKRMKYRSPNKFYHY